MGSKLKALSKDLVVRATRSAFDPEDMAGVSAPLGFWDPAGFAKDEEFVSSMQSHFSETAVKNFWPAFWIMTAGHELATTFADYDGKEEFDYGFDPLNLRPEDPEKATEYKTMELNHGRWAMFCAAGIIAQELVTGKAVI